MGAASLEAHHIFQLAMGLSHFQRGGMGSKPLKELLNYFFRLLQFSTLTFSALFTLLQGITTEFDCGVYTVVPCAEVYCFTVLC